MARKRTSRRPYVQARTLRRRVAARLQDGVDARQASVCVVELVHHVTAGVDGARATVTELARDIQPSAFHAASTASPAFRPRRRRGCEETGAAANDLVASQLLSASREIRGQRPMQPATASSPARTARKIVSTLTRAYRAASVAVINGTAVSRRSSAATRASRACR